MQTAGSGVHPHDWQNSPSEAADGAEVQLSSSRLGFHAETFHNKKFLKVSAGKISPDLGIWTWVEQGISRGGYEPHSHPGHTLHRWAPEGLPWGQHLSLPFSECLPLGPDPSHGHINGLYPLPSLNQQPPAPPHRGVKLPKGVMRTPAEPPPSGWLLAPQPPWKGAQSPTCHGSWPRPGLLWGHVGWCLSTSPGGLLSSFPV